MVKREAIDLYCSFDSISKGKSKFPTAVNLPQDEQTMLAVDTSIVKMEPETIEPIIVKVEPDTIDFNCSKSGFSFIVCVFLYSFLHFLSFQIQ
jgi:hypothetical protein